MIALGESIPRQGRACLVESFDPMLALARQRTAPVDRSSGLGVAGLSAGSARLCRAHSYCYEGRSTLI